MWWCNAIMGENQHYSERKTGALKSWFSCIPFTAYQQKSHAALDEVTLFSTLPPHHIKLHRGSSYYFISWALWKSEIDFSSNRNSWSLFHIFYLPNICLEGAPSPPFLSASTLLKNHEDRAVKQQIPEAQGLITWSSSAKHENFPIPIFCDFR